MLWEFKRGKKSSPEGKASVLGEDLYFILSYINCYLYNHHCPLLVCGHAVKKVIAIMHPQAEESCLHEFPKAVMGTTHPVCLHIIWFPSESLKSTCEKLMQAAVQADTGHAQI